MTKFSLIVAFFFVSISTPLFAQELPFKIGEYPAQVAAGSEIVLGYDLEWQVALAALQENYVQSRDWTELGADELVTGSIGPAE